jgi:fructose-bisphosphate aldolase class II
MAALTQSAKMCFQPKAVQQQRGAKSAVAGVAQKTASLSSVRSFTGPSVKSLTASRQSEVVSRRSLSVKASTSVEAVPETYAELNLKPGVVTGDDLMKLLAFAKKKKFAIPAVNCTSSSVINACLMAAKEANAPMIVQFSNGGGAFNAGIGSEGGMGKSTEGQIAGCVAGALHVRALAELYGVPIILHTDHCAKKLLPWFDGLLEANEEYYAKNGVPLFSSHMLDLSEEPLDENLDICKEYLARMDKIDVLLEMELGITGGEEDGVDNSDVAQEDLYSKPEEIYEVYQALHPISEKYTVAAAFGNVHGVYKPGNVQLTPAILDNAQKFISEKVPEAGEKPMYFVFHGGSGSTREEIREAIDYGVIKMNIDTDTQWSFWDGVKGFVEANNEYLQGQIGNPEGEDKPNKKYYDPRAWMKCAEKATVERLLIAYEDLNAMNVCA